ncbi:MAG: mechanosensitive ion channel domain-containing protein [Acidobacteriota bacterium]
METATLVREQLLATYQEFLTGAVAAMPKVAIGLVLLIVAFAVAKIVEWMCRAVLRRTHFDEGMKRLGVDTTLGRLGLTRPLSEVVPKLLYYLLLILFLRTMAEALELKPISDAIGGFLGYVPNMVSAFLIVLIGSTVGQLAAGAVGSAAENAGLEFGDGLGRFLSGLILLLSLLMAVGQLNIDTEIVRTVATCLFAGLALAFALSFGLGSRDVARNLLAGFYVRQVFRPGDTVEIEGARGTLSTVTPTLTVLDSSGTTVTVANAEFMEKTAKSEPVTPGE